MIKTSNRRFITFTESVIYFSVNWCLIFCLYFPSYPSTYQNIILKMKMEKGSLENFEDIDFSCVLRPHIKFLSRKRYRTLKIDPQMLKP